MKKINTPLSHHHFSSFKEAYQEIKNRISGNTELETYAKQLSQTRFGKFLIENRGLNAYWTDVVVNAPHHPHISAYTSFEQQLLLEMPTCQATQERFVHFKHICQTLMQGKLNILSAPSGLLPEFMALDYTHVDTLNIDAVDIDPHNFELLEQRLSHTSLKKHVTFRQQDIFELTDTNAYDLVVSNGLNIYIPDKQKIHQLYNLFFNSLKQGGVLVTSTLTPPPPVGHEWSMANINPENLAKQKALFIDILNITWSCYMDTEEFSALLTDIGFRNIEILWDTHKMFPTLKAQK